MGKKIRKLNQFDRGAWLAIEICLTACSHAHGEFNANEIAKAMSFTEEEVRKLAQETGIWEENTETL